MIWPLQLEMEKKKTVDFYFRLRKKKNAPKKFIGFLILSKFQLVRCKKPTWT